MEPRLFSIDEARALVPALLRLTERAMEELDETLQGGDFELAPRIEQRVRRWAAAKLLALVPIINRLRRTLSGGGDTKSTVS